MNVFRSLGLRARRASRADGAGESGLAALLTVHGLHAAGDALVTVALAGTLFFSVPVGEARGRVALYLVLTLLPFAFLVPVAGPLLDRFRHGRRNVLALATGGRGLLTWVMAGKVAGLGLYPLALGVLVLSRAYGVAKNAALPRVRPAQLGLVSTAARLNVAGTVGTAVAGAIGAGLSVLLGSAAVLYAASAVLVVAGVLAIRLPAQVDEPAQGPAERLRGRARLREAPAVVRRALAATAGIRALQGLLTLFLAFLLRQQGASKLQLGLVLGGAAVGALTGTVGAARVAGLSPRRLPYLAGVLAALACAAAALHGSTAMMALAAGASGLAGASAKFGLDATIQGAVPPAAVSTTFARSETLLQMSWVAGAGLALLLPMRSWAGFGAGGLVVVAGLLATRRAAPDVAVRRP
ncbi:MAG: MFS transporter [Actinobacteria bacterium]|nr:MFS transporter [Actinomycetota bacterium]MCA1719678.1 MFS transporter [Actinomycetota bacterium]